MILIYDNLRRIETDLSIIENLKRKGWVETIEEPVPYVEPAPYVPDEIPLWAFRSILTLQGLISQAQNLIDQLPEPAKTVATIQWEYGNVIVRTHPLIQQLGTALGLSSSQIDDIFIEADKLK